MIAIIFPKVYVIANLVGLPVRSPIKLPNETSCMIIPVKSAKIVIALTDSLADKESYDSLLP